jgi:hypothetical protein
VEAIVEEIREKLAIDLDPNPVMDRWPCILDAKAADPTIKKILLIRSSHAGKLAAALRKMGHHTDVIYEANWRATPPRSGAHGGPHLREAGQDTSGCCYLLCCR